MFAQLFGDKSWYQSLTGIGVALYAAMKSAEGTGLIPAGVSDNLVAIIEPVSAVLIALGIRKAATTANVK